MIDTILSLAISLLILLQAIVVRRVVGTWLFPAAIFGLFWFAVTFFPILLVIEAPVSPFALGYIAIACTLFSLSSVRRNWVAVFAQARLANGSVQFQTPFLFQAFIALSLLATAGHIVNMRTQGFSLSDMVNNLTETAGTYTALRYSDSIIQNIFNQVATVLTYITAMTGGLVFLSRRGPINSAIVLGLSFFPSLLVAATQSAKGALFLCLAMFLGAMAIYVNRSARTHRLTLSRSVYAAALIGIIVVVVAFSFLTRLGAAGDTDYLVRYFLSYSSSHIFAFSDWFSWYNDSPSIFFYREIRDSHGFYTFMAIFQIMGDDRFVVQGTFDEVFDFSFYLTGNIYTIYRGMIIDFGVPGSLVIVFVFGLISHQIYMSMLKGRSPNFAIAFSIMLYGAIYHSYLASIAMYLSIYVAVALMWLILLVNSVLFSISEQSAMGSRLATP